MTNGGRRGASGFLRDFQDFILRGNVIDLAVAVVIGGAFSKIVDAFVTLLMSVVLQPFLQQAKVNQLKDLPFGIGDLTIAIVNFLIIAFALFLIIRAVEKLQRKAEAQAEITAEPDPMITSQTQLKEAIERLTQTLESRQ
ncbi:large conductance mechanosensitive channel protein MscL [Synechocystis sp. LKSZ1]|uniref:large conductance mechanosensitive channel protein MscL n=1 Tax=Synechocystis sp. LKSZ1 TaxID=3144951 RepID=UPI00336BD786